MITGFVFDIYREIRRRFRFKSVATAVADLCFWLLLTPLMFGWLLLANWAELRGYVLAGMLLGVFLYVTVLRFFLLGGFMGLFGILSWVLTGLSLIATTLLVLPARLVGEIFVRLRLGNGPLIPTVPPLFRRLKHQR